MRRVIDDTNFMMIAEVLSDALKELPADKVSEYSWGTYRADGYAIRKYLEQKVPTVKFGKNLNTTGIGNNAKYEIIYLGNPDEEQICGAIGLTDDMFGSIIAYIQDIDSSKTVFRRKIRGIDPSNVRSSMYRYGGLEVDFVREEE